MSTKTTNKKKWDWVKKLWLIPYELILPLLLIGLFVFFLVLDIKSFWNQIKTNSRSVWNKFFAYVEEYAITFALVLIYIFFHRFWESWIDVHVTKQFLCYFGSTLLNDIIFIIALLTFYILISYKLFSVFYYGNKLKKVNRRTIILSVIAIAFWSYYRFNHGLIGLRDSLYYLELTPLYIFTPIKYFDIVLVYSIYKLSLYFIWRYDCYENTSNITFYKSLGFTRDIPISDKSEDLLERDDFAKTAVQKLLNTDTSKQSFTFGIDAPWGSGKTSFIYFMKKHLEFDNRSKIVIDFNPWLYSTDKDLITAFFDELSKTLKYYDKSLAKNLIDYSKLLSVFDTPETKSISSLLDILQPNDISLQEKKQQITDSIKSIKSIIIVFIDDLDRLNADEIMEMLKLIRNTSDFPYMYFVAAYDKSYLIKCLSEKMKSGATGFIEKIFEHEEILNLCSNESIRRALVDHLNIYNKNEIGVYIMDHNNITLNALTNLREVYRLSNRFNYSYEFSKGRINLVDLLLFELFKIKYPSEFSLFERNWNEVLKMVEHDNNQYYELFLGEEQDDHFDFVKYLKDHQEEMSLNEFDIKTIKIILEELFKKHETENKYPDRQHFRINDVKWFNRYLNLTELLSDIATSDFDEKMQMPFEEIKKAIDEWSVNKPRSLRFKLLNYDKEELTREQLCNLIKAVLYASIKNFWDDYQKLSAIISRLQRYNDGSFSEKDKPFILNLLKDFGYTDFTSCYVGYLRYDDSSFKKTPLQNEDLIEAQQSIFKDCCQKNSRYVFEYNILIVLRCFGNLLNIESIYSDNIVIGEKDNYFKSLVTLMKEFAKDNISLFLQVIINKLYQNEEYSIYSIVQVIWESWDQFKGFLNSSEIDASDPVIIEFKGFYDKFERSGYQPVQYDKFEIIKPR